MGNANEVLLCSPNLLVGTRLMQVSPAANICLYGKGKTFQETHLRAHKAMEQDAHIISNSQQSLVHTAGFLWRKDLVTSICSLFF